MEKGSGASLIRVTCPDCEDGLTGDHDCGEDTCCCLYPEPNVGCDRCDGKGYWILKERPTDETFKKLSRAGFDYEEIDDEVVQA